jgi:2-polyprenyl-6-methoxyphenol hydroxylase-like FAD-dependent oxidoreductase
MKAGNAEIVGAGFAGLTAACALAQRGWRVRVHERADGLRTTGAGIYIYENGLRVLEAVGAYEASVQGAPAAHTREVRDDRNHVISVHRWAGSRVFSIVRQNIINALAAAAARAGAEIVTNSTATGATSDGVLTLADGRRIKADLVVAADGSNSSLRDSLDLLSRRRFLVDGCTRLLISKTPAERKATDGGRTIEYWSGTRRVLYTPCSETEIYVALTMLDSDTVAKTLPVRADAWKHSFPHLDALIDRLGAAGRYDRFEMIELKRWSAGCVAIIGEYWTRWWLRDDECSLHGRLSRTQQRRNRRTPNLGARGTLRHRARTENFLLSRPADNMAASTTRTCISHARPITVAD